MAPQFYGPDGEFSPSAVVAALRSGGPEVFSDLLGAMAAVVREVALDPQGVYETAGFARGTFAHQLRTVHALRGALESVEARTVVTLADVTRREQYAAARDRAAHEYGAEPSKEAAHERADRATRRDLSLITQRSPHSAERTFASARRLVDSLPRMMSALGAGTIGPDAAYAVADATSALDPDLAREVDRRLGERLPDMSGAGTRRWRDAVATLAGDLAPEGAALRHRRARRERHLTLTPGQHGMATLSARMPAIEARLAHKRFSLEAERRRAEGDRQGHGALMVDAFTDAVLGRGTVRAPVTLDLGVIITDRALFRPDAGDIARIEGYGPVPAEAVREQLRAVTTEPEPGERDPFGPDGPLIRAVIRRLYTHPVAEELVAMESRARAFPPAMKRFLTWRDTTCRGPFCNAVARQADHITPHSRSGPTSLDNGNDLCGHCNQKERDTASVERIDDPAHPGHRVAWTGRAGTTRITAPTPLVWPRRPQEERQPAEARQPSLAGPGDAEPPADQRSSRTPGPEQSIDTAPPVTAPRRPPAAAPPAPPPASPPPPGRTAPAASAAAAPRPDRPARPSGRRKDRAAPPDAPDH